MECGNSPNVKSLFRLSLKDQGWGNSLFLICWTSYVCVFSVPRDISQIRGGINLQVGLDVAMLYGLNGNIKSSVRGEIVPLKKQSLCLGNLAHEAVSR